MNDRNDRMIVPGCLVYWSYQPAGRKWRSRKRERYDDVALVVAIHPHTAKIILRRSDGRLRERWVKLTRLAVAR